MTTFPPFQGPDGTVPEFDEIGQDLLQRIWERPELSRHDRSLITVASLMTQRVDDGQLRSELKAALANGVTRDEIAEVIVQVAMYAGWPAGANGSRRAREVYLEEDAA